MKRKELGALAEKVATEYLVKQGYRILDVNYRCPYGEIDIIAEKGRGVVFVEVRSRQSFYGHPEESITPRKVERLKKAISYYLALHSHEAHKAWYFDVVVVEFDREGKVDRLEHIPNALA